MNNCTHEIEIYQQGYISDNIYLIRKACWKCLTVFDRAGRPEEFGPKLKVFIDTSYWSSQIEGEGNG